jgi:hypothetical protein
MPIKSILSLQIEIDYLRFPALNLKTSVINLAALYVGLITNAGCVSCGFSRATLIHQEDVLRCQVNNQQKTPNTSGCMAFCTMTPRYKLRDK